MSLFQIAYDAIKNWKTPGWLKIFLKTIQDMLVVMLFTLGQSYMKQLQEKIIEAESHSDWSNEVKFMFVYNWGKTALPTIKESTLNMLIEILFNLLKQELFKKIK